MFGTTLIELAVMLYTVKRDIDVLCVIIILKTSPSLSFIYNQDMWLYERFVSCFRSYTIYHG